MSGPTMTRKEAEDAVSLDAGSFDAGHSQRYYEGWDEAIYAASQKVVRAFWHPSMDIIQAVNLIRGLKGYDKGSAMAEELSDLLKGLS